MAQEVDIFISERGKLEGLTTTYSFVRIPWVPDKIVCESGGIIRATYDILDRGPVEVPTGTGLWKYSWEGTLPGVWRYNMSMLRGTHIAPYIFHEKFEYWRENKTPLRLIVTGYPICRDVILDDYTWDAVGAFGDMDYKISFIEDRNIVIQTETVAVEPPPKRAESLSSAKTYTVKSGDCMWNIALYQLKNATRWPEIYQLNKEIIESTAKKYGRKSSNNGWWIYPGTVLSLPA